MSKLKLGIGKLKVLLLNCLTQGAKPKQLSMTIVLGFAFGVIPLLGVNTALCFVVALALRLNVVIIQAINYMVFPLQLLLMIPFFKIGDWVSFSKAHQLTSVSFSTLWNMKGKEMFTSICFAELKALLAWILIVSPIAILSYYILNYWFKKKRKIVITESPYKS